MVKQYVVVEEVQGSTSTHRKLNFNIYVSAALLCLSNMRHLHSVDVIVEFNNASDTYINFMIEVISPCTI